jgi:hypothetical protein
MGSLATWVDSMAQQASRTDGAAASAATLEGILAHDIGIAHILPRLAATDRARLLVNSKTLLGCCLTDGRLPKRACFINTAAAVAGAPSDHAGAGCSSLLQRSRGVTELVLDGVPPCVSACLAQLLSPPPPPPQPSLGEAAGEGGAAGGWAASVTSLTVRGAEQWRHLAEPPGLRHLSDRAHLPALRELSLEDVRLCDAAAAAVVARLPDLRALRLIRVRGGGLGVVGGLKSPLMPDGLAGADSLTRLTRLELDSAWPGSRSRWGMDKAFFRGLSSLRSLAALRVAVPTGSLRLPPGASLPAGLQELSLRPVDADDFAALLRRLALLAGGLRRLELGVVQPGHQWTGASVSLRGLSALRHLEHLAVTSCEPPGAYLFAKYLGALTALSALRHLGMGRDVYLDPDTPPDATPSLLTGLRSLCLLSFDFFDWAVGGVVSAQPAAVAATSASGAALPLPHLTTLECSMLSSALHLDLDLAARDPARCPLRGPLRRVPWDQLLELCLDFSDEGEHFDACSLLNLCHALAACCELRAVQLRASPGAPFPPPRVYLENPGLRYQHCLPPGSLARLESFRIMDGYIKDPRLELFRAADGVGPIEALPYHPAPQWLPLLLVVLERAEATLKVLQFSYDPPQHDAEAAEDARRQLLAATARCGELRRLGLLLTREVDLARLLDALGAMRHLEVLQLFMPWDDFEDDQYRGQAAQALAAGLLSARSDHRIVDVRVERLEY